MFAALRFNDVFTVLAGVHAGTATAGTPSLTPAIDLSKYRKLLFLVDSGTLGASGTLDFQVTGSTTSGGSYTAIPGTAITQLVKASNDSNYAVLEVDVAKIENLGLGYTFVKGSLLAGTANSTSAVIALGFVRHYGLASDDNDATVVQSTAL